MSSNPETLILRGISGRCSSLEHTLNLLDEDLLQYSDLTLHNAELRDVLATQVDAVREELGRLHREVKRALVLRLEMRT
jgi:hypothetical protein